MAIEVKNLIEIIVVSLMNLALLTIYDPFSHLKLDQPCAVNGQSRAPINLYKQKSVEEFNKLLEQPQTTNVSALFSRTLNYFYYFHCARIVICSLLVCVFPGVVRKGKVMLFYLFTILTNTLFIALQFRLFYVRFSNAGAVCSGDYYSLAASGNS